MTLINQYFVRACPEWASIAKITRNGVALPNYEQANASVRNTVHDHASPRAQRHASDNRSFEMASTALTSAGAGLGATAATQHIINDDQPSAVSAYTKPSINPANGLPMINDAVDIKGNTYGTTNVDDVFDSYGNYDSDFDYGVSFDSSYERGFSGSSHGGSYDSNYDSGFSISSGNDWNT